MNTKSEVSMRPLDAATHQYIEEAVKKALQEQRKWAGVTVFIERVSLYCFIPKDVLNQHKETIFDLYGKHSDQLPPSPPISENSLGYCDTSGLRPLAGVVRQSPKTPIPVEDALKPDAVSVSIHIEHANKWKGLRGRYGNRKESFLSQKIVIRHNLPVEDKKIQLTWFVGDDEQSYRTWFLVVPADSLSGDCLLGTHCQNSEDGLEEQHDDDEHRSDASQAASDSFGIPNSPHIATHPTEQLNDDLMDTLARMNARSNIETISVIGRGPIGQRAAIPLIMPSATYGTNNNEIDTLEMRRQRPRP